MSREGWFIFLRKSLEKARLPRFVKGRCQRNISSGDIKCAPGGVVLNSLIVLVLVLEFDVSLELGMQPLGSLSRRFHWTAKALFGPQRSKDEND